MVSVIMNIPLSIVPSADKLIWNDSELGFFTVKSAYFQARIYLGKESYDFSERKLLWKILWKAQVLPKIKMFTWRLIQNIIPCTKNLRERGVQMDDVCCVCRQERESLHHLFFECKLSQEVWLQINPNMRRFISNGHDAESFWQEWLDLLKMDGLVETGMIICWLLWNNRNICWHEQLCKTSTAIVLAV